MKESNLENLENPEEKNKEETIELKINLKKEKEELFLF